MYYVGIDWADQKHDITILDHDGNVVVKGLTIRKNYAGFEQLLARLQSLSDRPQDFKIGIETPHNLLVDFLYDHGYAVFTLFPGAMRSFRIRYRASGARDDVFDAFVLANVVRNDPLCWRPVEFGSEVIREIRLLVRDQHALQQVYVLWNNSLRSALKDYYPEYIHFFNDVACPTSLEFLDSYPTFESARHLSQEQLTRFFHKQHFYNRKRVNKIYDLLQQKHLHVAPVLIRAREFKALMCAENLKRVAKDLHLYELRLKELVEDHPDGQLFMSFPGVSYLTAARLLAMFGENRDLYSDVSPLQGMAGTCPVTDRTGENRRGPIYFRRQCNKLYRDISHNLAFSSLRQATWALVYYRHHRARGKTHSHALRCLANLNLRILFAMWKTRTHYQEQIYLAQKARHGLTNQK
jgi:hypothetical protein